MEGNTRLLGEIKGKVELILANQHDERERYDKLGDRVSAVEQKQYLYTGAAGALGAVLTAFFGHTFKWPF